MMDATEIARGLRKAQKNGRGWKACCPAHDDHEPSLDLDDGPDGKVLVKCRAGCTQDAVIAALKTRGVWPEGRAANGHDSDAKARRRIVATYDYRNDAGEITYQVVRYEPKGFRQRRPDPAKQGDWIWNMHGVAPLPYRLPELVASGSRAVLVCEGEKDADKVAALGLIATTNHGGAGKWNADLNRWFKGRTVYTLPHNDKAGREHAERVVRNLHGIAATVHVVQLPGLGDKGDAADWIEAGGTAEALQELCRAAPAWSPDDSGATGEQSPKPRFRLEAFADITIGDGPEWLVADIVPAAGFTVIYDEAGCGKSFLASDMGLAVALGLPWAGKEVQSGTVVYITAEGASGFRKRLVAYRQHHNLADVAVPFHVIAAAPNLGNDPGDVAELIGAIKDQAEAPIRAVIIDTLARTMHGADENSAAAMGLFADHCARIGDRLGCAVLALHHCGKDNGRGARGSSALRAAADCEILVEGSQERRTATCTKAKDGEDGWCLPFKLNRVEIEAPGRELSSCILEAIGEWAIESSKPAQRKPLSPKQQLALAVLSDLAIDGQPLPAEWQMPAGIKAVPATTFRDRLESRGVLDPESSNPPARWKELKIGLMTRKAIAEQDGLIWKL